ncbi:hypothetical protein FQN54_007062 [Arachnomyces sp. PD_36]|nr:hypothetical protein FQN54_007062 [Arachnomyces sp. PD_36]
MSYQLSVTICGPGTPEPAHWAFIIHQPPQKKGEIVHVIVLDETNNIFQFEARGGHTLTSRQAVGMCKLKTLSSAERSRVVSVLTNEVPAPRGGTKNCQDWLIDGLVALEVEELVPDGTTAAWAPRVGKLTDEIEEELGGDWIPLKPQKA